MRIAFIGVSHWHSEGYLDAAMKLPGIEIAGVSDEKEEVARQKSTQYGCRWYKDCREFIDREKCDLAFILDRHDRMPSIISAAVDENLPFCVEKPCAVRSSGIKKLVMSVEKSGLYNAVPFVHRLSPFTELILKWSREGLLGRWISLKFRYVTGSPERYEKWGCEWMLKKEAAGGGCTINLAVHYIDLLRYITGENIVEVKSFLSKKKYRKEVEDYSLLTLKTDSGTLGEIETGYISAEYPADRDTFEVRTEKRHVVFRENTVHWHDFTGETGELPLPSVNTVEIFMRNLTGSFIEGRKPVAGLHDAFHVLKVIDKIYG